MFKKILFCAVSASLLAPACAFAGDGSFHYAHRRPVRAYGHYGHMARPRVIKGYYAETRPALRRFRAYGGMPPTFIPGPAADYTPPVLAYTSATAYVPIVTYAAVPIRVYYVPQQQPLYNVPPYAVRALCVCD